MDIPETLNIDYMDVQYRRWKEDPKQVSKDWHFFFQGFEAGFDMDPAAGACDPAAMRRQARVEALISEYRHLGHLMACLDPLVACPTSHPLLELESFGLKAEDLKTSFAAPALFNQASVSLAQIIEALKATYCRSIGVEYMHLQDPEERRWLQQHMEPVRNRPAIDAEQQRRIHEKLMAASLFEQFLNKKYPGQTRFSLEGAEVLIPMLDALVEDGAAQECREIVLGMAHRGRLNVQVNILGKGFDEIFSEFESCYDPENLTGAGDVKYHKGYLADLMTTAGQPLRILLVNNPSHLETVDPVVEGIARARQASFGEDGPRKVLPLLIHGDAAFAGQGVVAETLNLSQLEGYRTGGTLHLVINNQIGYTTLPEDARSTRYSTDIAKMLMVPIFHVHGEDPEAAVHIIRLAAAYRRQFQKDAVVDVVCYRRYGHNEGDEPYFTQPQMYERIKERTVPGQAYADRLLNEGVVQQQDLANLHERLLQPMEAAYGDIHGSICAFPEARFYEEWEGIQGRFSFSAVSTGVEEARLRMLAERLNHVPEGFKLHDKLAKLLQKRIETVRRGEGIDWANAEILAFAALLTEGVPVRLSGQDCRRGTFSQRHSVWTDADSGETYEPLNHLDPDQAPFSVFNSSLSEAGVLGFEYGYALAAPGGLTLWEAQFGDFANNAQAVVDLYIASAQSKWGRLNGLVMLLPHGYEGLGPEHSSARPERFLQLAAEDNIQICNPTTPAQHFHLLRRQVKADFRKPLIILTPKSLLRHPLAVSTLADMAQSGFQPVIDDVSSFGRVRTLLFCSGKIYYELLQRRQVLKADDRAIIRLEQLYPFPAEALQTLLAGRSSLRQCCWVQEEPENMGAWRFVRPLIEDLLGDSLTYIGRPEAASPATGFPHVYRQEQAAVVDRAVGPAPN